MPRYEYSSALLPCNQFYTGEARGEGGRALTGVCPPRPPLRIATSQLDLYALTVAQSVLRTSVSAVIFVSTYDRTTDNHISTTSSSKTTDYTTASKQYSLLALDSPPDLFAFMFFSIIEINLFKEYLSVCRRTALHSAVCSMSCRLSLLSLYKHMTGID